jgi:hypothetical protein
VGEVLGTLHALALPAAGPVTPWLTSRRSEDDWNRIVATVRSKGAEWAPALEDALPAILDISTILADEDGPAIMCVCDLSPSSVRTAGAEGLVVTHWDFAGAFHPRLELGYVLGAWGIGHDGGVNEGAVRALMAAYRSRADAVPKLELSMFAADVSAWLNWTVGRMAGALETEGLERQRREVLELRGLLSQPRSRELYEQILAAASLA